MAVIEIKDLTKYYGKLLFVVAMVLILVGIWGYQRRDVNG